MPPPTPAPSLRPARDLCPGGARIDERAEVVGGGVAVAAEIAGLVRRQIFPPEGLGLEAEFDPNRRESGRNATNSAFQTADLGRAVRGLEREGLG